MPNHLPSNGSPLLSARFKQIVLFSFLFCYLFALLDPNAKAIPPWHSPLPIGEYPLSKPSPLNPVPEAIVPVRPVSIIFSSHAGAKDGRWVAEQLRQLVESTDPHHPITVWLEHAQPVLAPRDILELQTRYSRLLAPGQNWYEEIMKNPMSETSFKKLRQLFGADRVSESYSLLYFFLTEDPFHNPIRDQILALRKQGRKIFIQPEKPNFQAYLLHLRQNVASLLAIDRLANGYPRGALSIFAGSYHFLAQALRLRDQELGQRIAQEHARHPRTAHIVIRGIAHYETLTVFFPSHGLHGQTIIQSPSQSDSRENQSEKLHRYLFQETRLPSPQFEKGRRFFIEQLLETSLLSFLRTQPGPKLPSESVSRGIESLPNSVIQRWLHGIASHKDGDLTHLGRLSWEWLCRQNFKPFREIRSPA